MITIDWGNRIINVPKSFMTQIQVNPTEIRELDLNAFRLALKDLEDDAEGMAYVDTHRHNTEILLGGITYARTLEIINGFTVTFEDGQYAVNLVGANSNVGDVVNVNQVSVRSSNAAGLISNQAVEYSSFNGGVMVDENDVTGKSTSGSLFPIGTGISPVNNLVDAKLIASFRGLRKIMVKGDLEIGNESPSISFEDFEFVGESQVKTLITIGDSANVLRCEFFDCTLTGTLDGNSQAERCVLKNLNFFNGFAFKCTLWETISLGPGIEAHMFDCFSHSADLTTPTIDMNGTGIACLRNYYGDVRFVNYNGDGVNHIDLSAGQLRLHSTITSGTFVVRGVGKLVDDATGAEIQSGTWNGGVTIVNELVTAKVIKDIETIARQIKAMTAAGL